MNKKFNVCLLSFGMSGKVFHAPLIKDNPQLNLYGCLELSEKKVHLSYPNCISFDNYEDILNDALIDIIVVNTPTYTHFDYTLKALKAHKNIVVEKCFTSNLEEALLLQDAAKNSRSVVSIYHNKRWDRDFVTVAKAIQENLLGDIVQAVFRFERYKPGMNVKKHKEDTNAGSGILKDLGSHIIDMSICLFGMPISVFANIYKNRTGSLVDDTVLLSCQYPKFSVQIYLSLLAMEPQAGFYIQGKKALLKMNRADKQEVLLSQGILPSQPEWDNTIKPAEIYYMNSDNSLDNYLYETPLQMHYGHFYDAFILALETNQKPVIGIEDGIKVMRIIDAAIKSSLQGQVIFL
ncbi:MAG: Gfo/Idh/MocA family oxidoreductase [Alphaproteobacteria bacterium]|nr:Gfo/Idh/MocA family oxidoreductase [Alphaproteobacteria bacterium]